MRKGVKEQYSIHKSYVKGRIETTKKIGVKVRLPSIPEDISENIVKYIIINKQNDKTCIWNCKVGDLYSTIEGKQECKCFTSDGPPSFTPSSDWDVIYFLDARNYLNDRFILYRILLKRTSEEWKKIKMSLNHRPIQTENPAHQKFLIDLLEKLNVLSKKIDVSNEIETVRSQIIEA
jgi:hypothetical protein